jgi:hypothetical protein
MSITNTMQLTRTASIKFCSSFLAILLVLAGLAGGVARAQLSGTGAISGTVQDPTGAIVAGASVTATNVDTNVQTARKTTSAGNYNITPLIPGTYIVTVAASGFEGYIQENITVNALETVAVNAKLTVGRATESVTITSAPPLLETTDATLGATMDNEMYSNLPLQMSAGNNADQRRATDFAYLMPGVSNVYTGTANATSATTGVNGSGPAGGVQEMYIDGVELPEGDGIGDPRFTWTAIGVDAVNQFQVQTAGVSSQYAGQGLQNYSIKSGGNGIHGSLYEYNRNTLFDAWAFTSKVTTLRPDGQYEMVKPREIQNEFGLVISGPIIKDKLFFFGNYGQYRYQHGATISPYTIPTSAMLGLTAAGGQLGYADFTGYALANGAAATCTSTSKEGTASNVCYDIYDPNTETPGCLGTSATVSPCNRTPFQGMKNGVLTADVIPGSRLSQASQYINQYWVPYENLANQSSYVNNLNYGTPTGLANWYLTGRIDYAENAKNQVAIIVAFGRQASTGPNSGSGLGPPFNTSQSYHPVTNVDIVKDTFTISSHLVNQFAIGYGRYFSLSVTPDDAPQYNAASIGLLNTPPGQASNGFPRIDWSGGANSVVSQQAGYTWNSKSNNTYTATDNVQWQFGKHNFTFGGQYNLVLFGLYSALGPTGPMDYSFSAAPTQGFSSILTTTPGKGTATLGTSGSPIATYMLGAATGESVLSLNVPGTRSVWRSPSFWAQDDYKVTEKLTLNLGLRWDIYQAFQEAHNIFSFFNPTGANSVTGNLGTVQFAGNGDPALYCNCNSPSPTYWKNIAPRVGFAYSVDPKTVIRGSYSVNYARGNWTAGGGGQKTPGTLGLTPSGSTPTQATPSFPLIYWDGTACAQGTNTGVNCGFNGSVAAPAPPKGGTSLAEYGTGANSTTTASASSIEIFDPIRGSRAPEYINWTIGLQRQITHDMSITVSYVGSEGHFVSGGLDPWQMKNGLPSTFAALAAYQPSGTNTVPCTGLTCTTPLLGTKWSATNQALFQSLGFTPPNPYTGGVTYTASNSTSGYFTKYPQYGVSDTTNFTGNTNYHALQLTLRQRAAHGVDFMFNYTFSKSIDDVGTFRTTDNARLDRSLSVTDQPQNITGTVVYLSPFGKGRMASNNFLVRSLARDWSLSGIFTYHSGSPVLFTGTGCAGTPMGTCMPSVVPGVKPRTASYAKPAGGIVAGTGYANTYTTIHHLDLNAFSVLDAANTTPTNTQLGVPVGLGLAGYVPGNAARVGADNVWGMGTYNVDLGLKRSFPIWQKVSIQFEADLLNATNHVVFGSPGGAVGNGSATQSGTTITGTTSYGLISGVSNQPRDMQLSARLNW